MNIEMLTTADEKTPDNSSRYRSVSDNQASDYEVPSLLKKDSNTKPADGGAAKTTPTPTEQSIYKNWQIIRLQEMKQDKSDSETPQTSTQQQQQQSTSTHSSKKPQPPPKILKPAKPPRSFDVGGGSSKPTNAKDYSKEQRPTIAGEEKSTARQIQADGLLPRRIEIESGSSSQMSEPSNSPPRGNRVAHRNTVNQEPKNSHLPPSTTETNKALSHTTSVSKKKPLLPPSRSSPLKHKTSKVAEGENSSNASEPPIAMPRKSQLMKSKSNPAFIAMAANKPIPPSKLGVKESSSIQIPNSKDTHSSAADNSSNDTVLRLPSLPESDRAGSSGSTLVVSYVQHKSKYDSEEQHSDRGSSVSDMGSSCNDTEGEEGEHDDETSRPRTPSEAADDERGCGDSGSIDDGGGGGGGVGGSGELRKKSSSSLAKYGIIEDTDGGSYIV